LRSIIDTKSDVRANPKISGTGHNIFGIQTGVAIMFLVHKAKKENKICNIQYISMDDFWRKDEKLQWFTENEFKTIPFEYVLPDKNNNWINNSDNDFDTLLPLCDKSVKAGKSKKALFELFSLGVVTNRDEWVYDNNNNDLSKKIAYLISIYQKDLKKLEGTKREDAKNSVDYSIKWTRAVLNDLIKGKEYFTDNANILNVNFRPFIKKYLYYSKQLNEMQYLLPNIFGIRGELVNTCISFYSISSSWQLSTLAVNKVFDLGYLKQGNGGTFCLSIFRYNKDGNRQDNITDWGLNQFTKQYKTKKITKEDIFHYTYAVLHYPTYRAKYELNLKREFPRIPFYEDFNKWATWGRALMELHINYETVKPYPLNVRTAKESIDNPKPKLKTIKTGNTIVIDENTLLSDIPPEAWEYKLGNRSAMEWVLDQYKESKPKDPTIAEKFNTYRFADYKEQVIDLLKRVCTVSVETMKIINEMKE